MAKRVIHQLVDDLEGTVLEPGSGETVTFSLDGTAYEIDLTDANAAALRNSFAKYIDVAQKVTATRSGAARKRQPSNSRNVGAIRVWARERGYAVSDRGRIPAHIIEAYDAAHS